MQELTDIRNTNKREERAMNIDHVKLLHNVRKYALIVATKTFYYAAQTFAFVACQLDDFHKYLDTLHKRYES